MDLIKHSTVTVRKYGERGFDMSLPAAWVEESGLGPGDKIDLFIDAGTRSLVIKPATNGKTEPENESQP